MSSKKIGVFGGTFDPPHIGHLILASEAAHQLHLSRLLWVLAPEPPHKLDQTITPLSHRLAMLQHTVADNSIFEISRLEIDRPGPHYSIDTIQLLAKQEPDAEITLLLGGNSLRDLPTWRSPTELVAAASNIGVMRRPGNSFDMTTLETQIPGLSQKVSFIDSPLQNLSSHEIRQRIRDDKVYRYYVLPSVYKYIESNNLYHRE